jgi:hypothetical protein
MTMQRDEQAGRGCLYDAVAAIDLSHGYFGQNFLGQGSKPALQRARNSIAIVN